VNAVQLRLVISVRILSWCQSVLSAVVLIIILVILELMNVVAPFWAFGLDLWVYLRFLLFTRYFPLLQNPQ